MDDWKVSSVKQSQHLIAYCTRWVCDLHCLPSSPNSRLLPRFPHASLRGTSAFAGGSAASRREESRWNTFQFVYPSSPGYSHNPKVMTVCPRAQKPQHPKSCYARYFWPRASGHVWRNWVSLFAGVIKSWHESWERIELRMLLYTECPVSGSSAMEPQGQLHHILPASQLTSKLIQPNTQASWLQHWRCLIF